MSTFLRATFCFALVAQAGCYSPSVPNGTLQCSANSKCPEKFHCAADNTCWADGKDPVVTPDMAGTGGGDLATTPSGDMAKSTIDVVSAKSGTAVLSGGVSAKSENFKLIMSTGQAPGGNANSSSPNFKKSGGIVGATQNSK